MIGHLGANFFDFLNLSREKVLSAAKLSPHHLTNNLHRDKNVLSLLFNGFEHFLAPNHTKELQILICVDEDGYAHARALLGLPWHKLGRLAKGLKGYGKVRHSISK